MRLLTLIAAFLLGIAPALADETRSAPEGHVPPPATVDGLGWLAGSWVGDGIDGAPAQEVYSAPAGGAVAGHFVQEDGEGGVAFLELLQIAERDGSLVYRLKHFGPDLVGWEERERVVSFPLVAIAPGALYFDGLTLRQDGADGLLAAVRVKHEDGSLEEYAFHYRRAGKPAPAPQCPDAVTTLEVNDCLGAISARADEEMERYLAAVLEQVAGKPEVAAGIRDAQANFLVYREQECGAIYTDWIDGTIRTAMALTCRTEMARERTHRLWRNWLTYADSTPPVLPEPKPGS